MMLHEFFPYTIISLAHGLVLETEIPHKLLVLIVRECRVPKVGFGIRRTVITVGFIAERPIQVPHWSEDVFTIGRGEIFFIKIGAFRVHKLIVTEQFVDHQITGELVYIHEMGDTFAVFQGGAETIEIGSDKVDHLGRFVFAILDVDGQIIKRRTEFEFFVVIGIQLQQSGF